MTDAVVRAVEGESPPEETLRALQVGLPYMLRSADLSEEAILAGQTAARLGYFSRAIEFDTLHAAREADLDLLDALSEKLGDARERGDSGHDTLVKFAAAMASSESLDPSPEGSAPSWMLPGAGGAFRGQLADHLLGGVGPPGPDNQPTLPPDVTMADLKRTWKYGFFLRALEEFFEDGAPH